MWSKIFFFFQAEDGIRDIGVTGVQTCALPIYDAGEQPETLLRARRARDYLLLCRDRLEVAAVVQALDEVRVDGERVSAVLVDDVFETPPARPELLRVRAEQVEEFPLVVAVVEVGYLLL